MDFCWKVFSQVQKDGCSKGMCCKSFKHARVNCGAVIRDLKNQIIERVSFSSTLPLGQCLFVQAGRQKVSPLSSYCEQKQREPIQADRSGCHGWMNIQTTPKLSSLLMATIHPWLTAGERRRGQRKGRKEGERRKGICVLKDGWKACQGHFLSQRGKMWWELWRGTQCCLLGMSRC